jgi:anti-anti-sigma factor
LTVLVALVDDNMPASMVELRAAVAAAVRSGARTLVIDVSRVDQLSSSTVTALLWAQRRCRSQGGDVILRGVSRRQARTLQRAGLTHVFELEGRPHRRLIPLPRIGDR